MRGGNRGVRGCQREVSFATHDRTHIPMVVRMSKRGEMEQSEGLSEGGLVCDP